MTKLRAMPCWRMSPCPTPRAVVRRSLMLILPGLMLMGWMPSIGSAQQSKVAVSPDGLHLVGTEYHARDIWSVIDGFAAQPSANLIAQWSVPEPGLKPGGPFKGTICYTPAELISHFRSLPAERTARGMFITGDLTHLEDPAPSKAQMTEYVKLTDYQKKLVADPEWVAAHKKSIEELVAACEKAKIDLWINVNLGGKNLRFRKLTK